MMAKDQFNDVMLHSTAIARKIASKTDLNGPEVLLAGLVVALGQTRAEPLLKQAGVRDVKALIAAIPDATPEEARGLLEIRADSDLALLITGPLAGFLAGESTPEEALDVLLRELCRKVIERHGQRVAHHEGVVAVGLGRIADDL